jgi:endoglucanase
MLKRRILKLAVATALTALALGTPAAAATVSGHAGASGSLNANPARSGKTGGDPTWIYNYNSALCLGISGGDDDAPAVIWTCEATANQEWHQGPELGDTGYYEQVNGDGQCLEVTGDDEGTRVYGWTCDGALDEYWSHSGLEFFEYTSGYVLGVAGGSTAVGAAVVQWPFTGAENQYWDTTGTLPGT